MELEEHIVSGVAPFSFFFLWGGAGLPAPQREIKTKVKVERSR